MVATLTPPSMTDAPAAPVRLGRPTPLAVVGWAALIAVSALWGVLLARSGTKLFLPSPPLFARWRPHPSVLLVPAGCLAVAVVAWGPRLASRIRWRHVLVVSAAAVVGWTVLLALAAGNHGLAQPFRVPDQYPHDVPAIKSLGGFLAGFVGHLPRYATHVRSHPPGFLMLLWALTRLGIDSAVAATSLALAGAVAAAVAALVALRELAGETWARRAAPFLVLAPAAVWMLGAADAFFAGVGATAVALLAVATGQRGRASDAAAAAAGALFGIALFLSYGLVLLLALPAAIAVARRRARPVIVATVPLLAVVAAFAAGGFSWLDGLRATHAQYYAGVASSRPYSYFLVADVAAFAVALGPAAAAGVATLRQRRVWLLTGTALAAIALADLSGLSKAETERIWLPFTPWVLLAACALPRPRRWLAIQAGVALVLIAGFHFPW